MYYKTVFRTVLAGGETVGFLKPWRLVCECKGRVTQCSLTRLFRNEVCNADIDIHWKREVVISCR